eukprot:5294819-Prymnesium_polylepis.2
MRTVNMFLVTDRCDSVSGEARASVCVKIFCYGKRTFRAARRPTNGSSFSVSTTGSWSERPTVPAE